MSRAFLPLAAGPHLVIVAPDRDGVPDEAAIRPFAEDCRFAPIARVVPELPVFASVGPLAGGR